MAYYQAMNLRMTDQPYNDCCYFLNGMGSVFKNIFCILLQNRHIELAIIVIPVFFKDQGLLKRLAGHLTIGFDV